jgi:hypothetical protein
VDAAPGQQTSRSSLPIRSVSRGCLPTAAELFWPVETEAELQDLEALLQDFSARADAMSTASIPARAGTVVGIGAAASLAELYARLTGRTVGTGEDLLVTNDCAVVLCLEIDLNYSLLEHMYRQNDNFSAPGLLLAPNLADLRRQVLLKSAALHLEANMAAGRTDFSAVDAFQTTEIEDWTLVSGEASRAEVLAALGSGRGLLRMVTHADGIDASLGREAALCPLAGRDEQDIAPDPPLCVITGNCHRSNRSVAEALSSGYAVPAERIRAGVLILDACWGLIPPMGVNGIGWRIARQIASNRAIHACLTTWEIVRNEFSTTLPLADLLMKGLTLGEALARHNAAPQRLADGHRMCLLGDPELALPPQPEKASSAQIWPVVDLAPLRRALESIAFFRSYVLRTSALGHRTFTDRTEQALASIDRFERTALTQARAPTFTSAVGSEMVQAMLDFLVGRWAIPASNWAGLIESSQYAAEQTPCLACGLAARIFVAGIALPGLPQRRVTECPSCGYSLDLPLGQNLAFTHAGGVIEIGGDAPCAARLFIHNHMPGPALAWPVGKDGTLAPRMAMPKTGLKGQVRLSLFAIWPDYSFATAGFFTRGERLDAHVTDPGCPS